MNWRWLYNMCLETALCLPMQNGWALSRDLHPKSSACSFCLLCSFHTYCRAADRNQHWTQQQNSLIPVAPGTWAWAQICHHMDGGDPALGIQAKPSSSCTAGRQQCPAECLSRELEHMQQRWISLTFCTCWSEVNSRSCECHILLL